MAVRLFTQHLEKVRVSRHGGFVTAVQALNACLVVIGLQEEVSVTDCAALEKQHLCALLHIVVIGVSVTYSTRPLITS